MQVELTIMIRGKNQLGGDYDYETKVNVELPEDFIYDEVESYAQITNIKEV